MKEEIKYFFIYMRSNISSNISCSCYCTISIWNRLQYFKPFNTSLINKRVNQIRFTLFSISITCGTIKPLTKRKV